MKPMTAFRLRWFSDRRSRMWLSALSIAAPSGDMRRRAAAMRSFCSRRSTA